MLGPADHLPVTLVLDNIRSLHNVGALFRSADGVRLERIILCGLTPTPPRPEIDKTALGAVQTVTWEYHPSTLTVVRQLLVSMPVYALEQSERATSLFTTNIALPCAIIVGHERMGVSPEVLGMCTGHIDLPMRGRSAHSLNVSNATAVALYELRRRSEVHSA